MAKQNEIRVDIQGFIKDMFSVQNLRNNTNNNNDNDKNNIRPNANYVKYKSSDILAQSKIT